MKRTSLWSNKPSINYDETTNQTMVNGVHLNLNLDDVVKALYFLRELERKVSNVAINKLLDERKSKLKHMCANKRGISSGKMPNLRF